MKTTLDHFKEHLTPEELERAVKNTPKNQLNYKTETQSQALSGAFNWHYSTEGYDYWDAIYARLLNNQK